MRIAPELLSLEIHRITLDRRPRISRREELSTNYVIGLRGWQPSFAWLCGLGNTNGSPKIAEELLKSRAILIVTSIYYGVLHKLAWQSKVPRKTQPDEVFWKLSCLPFICLGLFAICMWVGFNQVISIAVGIFGVIALLTQIIVRKYLLMEVILVVHYLDFGFFKSQNELHLTSLW